MIVVAGEALIDLIPTDTGELSVNPGGGPFNTARWLACLGQEVAFLGALAADPLGRRLRQALAQAGVNLDLVVSTELPTTLALAQLDAAGVAQYSFYADATSVRALDAHAPNASLPALPELTALQVGGVALVLPPSAMALERAVELARQRRALVLFDPNIRPGLIPDREEYMRRFEHVLEHTDVLKLSVEDLDWLAPGGAADGDRDRAVASLLDGGPAIVLLTDGGAGVTVYTRESGPVAVAHVPAETVVVADTIGAGDAFAAGFLAHLLGAPAAATAPTGGAGRLSSPGGRFLDPPPAGRLSSDGGREIDPQGLLADRLGLINAVRFAARIAGIACAQRGAEPPATLPAIASA